MDKLKIKFTKQVSTMETLRDEIQNVFQEIKSEKCAKRIENFVKRKRTLIASEGKILEKIFLVYSG